jgi:hypothetical protein
VRSIFNALIVTCALAGAALSQTSKNPFLGRWDFNVTTPTGPRANWLGVSQKAGKVEIWFQPTGGHVFQLKDFELKDNHLSFTASPASGNRPATTWELAAKGDTLTGVQKRGTSSTPLTGVRAPDLKRPTPKAWTKPEPIFNGKNLDGWEPFGNVANNHWTVKDGLLVNEAHGANLKSTREFNDFKVHFEVNCPDEANSGFYLRGRYEVQLEYEPLGTEPMERSMGSIYGRLAPSKQLPRMPGQWETFDITLVGRTLTIVRNGTKIIDAREIEGITGGAMNADEGKPGPFYIQGDHTGGLKFRNITVSVPKQ